MNFCVFQHYNALQKAVFIITQFLSTVKCEEPNSNVISRAEDCQVTPVIHVLQYPGCVPKPIPSFACTGRCSSYVQVGLNFDFHSYSYKIK